MPFDPSTATPVEQTQSSAFDPSTAKPVTQGQFDPSTAKPVDELDNVYAQESDSLNSEDTTSVDTVPIPARAASGLMRTPQGKADVINKISPQMNATVSNDGTVFVNGKPFNLNPEDIGAFLYDLPGMISEATTKNIPLAANVATTMATGGLSLPAQMILQGGAMATGEAVKELAAQGLAQEKPSGMDIGMNAIAGAAGPVADRAFMATANGMKSIAKNLSKFVGPAKDVGPEILSATAGIKLGVGDKVFEKMDNGEDLSKIITPENADGAKPSAILSNSFYGSPSAARTPENFVNTLKSNIENTVPENMDSMKKMYQDIWGLSPQTIDTVIKNPTKDVINSGLFAQNAPLTVGANFAQKLAEGDKVLENEYGKTLRAAMASGKTKQVNIGQALQEMFQSGDINAGGVGIFDKGSINNGYTGNAAKGVYNQLLKNLTENGSNISDEGSKILQDLLNKNPEGFKSTGAGGFQTNLSKDQVSKLTNGGYFKTMPADQAYRFLAEIKPLLNKTFDGESLSGAEKGPLAGFMKNIRGQLGEISPEMKAMNQKYETYQSARTFFGDGKVGNLQDMLNMNNKMAQAYSDPSIRSFLGNLDKTLGNKELTNMVDHLGASQEIKAFFDKATGKSEDKLQSLITSIKGLADKTANHSVQNMAMSGYDAILPQNKKFLDPMWNHLIANEFQNKPISIFKAKYIGLMALAATGMGHAGVLPALGVGMALSSPKNIARGLMATQRIKGINNTIAKGSKIASKAGQMTGRLVLNQLLQSSKKAKEASNKK